MKGYRVFDTGFSGVRMCLFSVHHLQTCYMHINSLRANNLGLRRRNYLFGECGVMLRGFVCRRIRP